MGCPPLSGCALLYSSTDSGYFEVVLSASVVQCSGTEALHCEELLSHLVPICLNCELRRGSVGRTRIIKAVGAGRFAQAQCRS